MRIICDGLLFSRFPLLLLPIIVLVVIADFLGIFVEKRRKSLDPFKIPWNAKKLFRDERFTTVS